MKTKYFLCTFIIAPMMFCLGFTNVLEQSETQPKINSGSIIRSPITMKGISSSRSSETSSLHGTKAGETAVLRALRWLKTTQKDNGTWADDNSATALAMKCFFMHGETPNSEQCPEFAQTVGKGITALLNISDRMIADTNSTVQAEYTDDLPLIAIALFEAYQATMNKRLLENGQSLAIQIVNLQNPEGDWNREETASDPTRILYSGWSVQALKHARSTAKEYANEKRFDSAMMRLATFYEHEALKIQSTNSIEAQLPAVGAYILLLCRKEKTPETQAIVSQFDETTRFFENNTCDWSNTTIQTIQHLYFITQASFHRGGTIWMRWNKTIWPLLIDQQQVIEDAYINDVDGHAYSIGWWDSSTSGRNTTTQSSIGNRVQATSLSALQLMIYYAFR